MTNGERVVYFFCLDQIDQTFFDIWTWDPPICSEYFTTVRTILLENHNTKNLQFIRVNSLIPKII